MGVNASVEQFKNRLSSLINMIDDSVFLPVTNGDASTFSDFEEPIW